MGKSDGGLTPEELKDMGPMCFARPADFEKTVPGATIKHLQAAGLLQPCDEVGPLTIAAAGSAGVVVQVDHGEPVAHFQGEQAMRLAQLFQAAPQLLVVGDDLALKADEVATHLLESGYENMARNLAGLVAEWVKLAQQVGGGRCWPALGGQAAGGQA